MKGFFNFKEIFSDKIISWGNILTFFIVLISLIFIAIQFRLLPPYIPIFNQLPWGNERLGNSLMIFLPAISAASLAIVNIFISSAIYGKSQVISRMLTVSSMLIAFLSFLFIIRTIQLIT